MRTISEEATDFNRPWGECAAEDNDAETCLIISAWSLAIRTTPSYCRTSLSSSNAKISPP